MFVIGELYNRRDDIHEHFSGQRQGGITTPSEHPLVFIFTGEEGHAYGYKDGWNEDGLFYYTGEGQVGDQKMWKGNKAILEHQQDGKELLLFKREKKGHYRFLGQMACVGYHEALGTDRNNEMRKVLVFELVPQEQASIGTLSETESSQVLPSSAKTLSLDELYERATAKSKRSATPIERKTNYYERSEYTRLFALRRADGHCEGCGVDAPFSNKAGDPYLEVHHLKRLSDEGPDTPANVIALCPNCHRRIHEGKNGDEYNRELLEKAQS